MAEGKELVQNPSIGDSENDSGEGVMAKLIAVNRSSTSHPKPSVLPADLLRSVTEKVRQESKSFDKPSIITDDSAVLFACVNEDADLNESSIQQCSTSDLRGNDNAAMDCRNVSGAPDNDDSLDLVNKSNKSEENCTLHEQPTVTVGHAPNVETLDLQETNRDSVGQNQATQPHKVHETRESCLTDTEMPQGSTEPLPDLHGETSSHVVEDNVLDLSLLFSGELEKRRKTLSKRSKFKKSKKMNKGSQQKYDDNGAQEEGPTKSWPHRVNHFIAIPIRNKQIKSKLAAIQDEILEEEPLLESARVKVASLHITIMVMSLASPEELQRARDALDECWKKLQEELSTTPYILDIHGLDHFRHGVLFAKATNQDWSQRLEDIAETVEQTFNELGIVSPDAKAFKPHITIFKLSKMRRKTHLRLKKIDPDLYGKWTECEFGQETVTSLHLCSMVKPKDEHGYYYKEHSVGHDLEDTDSDSVLSLQTNDDVDLAVKDVVSSLLTKVEDLCTNRQRTGNTSLLKDETPQETDNGKVPCTQFDVEKLPCTKQDGEELSCTQLDGGELSMSQHDSHTDTGGEELSRTQHEKKSENTAILGEKVPYTGAQKGDT